MDVNAPDMYIPIMGVTSYVMVICIMRGLEGSFHPQLIRSLASSTAALLIVELAVLKLGTYLVGGDSKTLDMVAYSGYKFVCITIVSLLKYYGVFKWIVFLYLGLANSFFLLRSMRFLLLPPDGSSTVSPRQRQRRIQLLFVFCVVIQNIFVYFYI